MYASHAKDATPGIAFEEDIKKNILRRWPFHLQFVYYMKAYVPDSCTLRRFAFEVSQDHWGELKSISPDDKINLKGELTIPYQSHLPDGNCMYISSFNHLWECTYKWVLKICV